MESKSTMVQKGTMEFKIGDRVKIVNDEQGLFGREGTINDAETVECTTRYCVELRGDMGSWWFEDSHIGGQS